jgi:hypothetical protein
MNVYLKILTKTSNSGMLANTISSFSKNYVALEIDAAQHFFELRELT